MKKLLITVTVFTLLASSCTSSGDRAPAPSATEPSVTQPEPNENTSSEPGEPTTGTLGPPAAVKKPSTTAPTRKAPASTPRLTLEATGQPYQPGEVGPRVQPGEEEVTAYATGLRPDAPVRWCAGPVASECYFMPDQRTDSEGRSIFRFIVPSSEQPGDWTVLIRYLNSSEALARADFAVVPNTNASCPEGAPNCT
ncbi:hypothetical protein KY386_00165 [Candidatus Parcubacteria bacterium]|nr:hypothetical protein [Candidatus Parcubacteria bacterium]